MHSNKGALEMEFPKMTKVTANEIRDCIINRVHAYRMSDDHAVMRPDLDRLMRYARRLYEAAIPTLTVDLQVHAAAILATWDMSAIEALGDEDHAWACHQAAETCIGMRKALAVSGQTDLRPELQLCHMALIAPWSVQLEVAVEKAHEAAVLSARHPGITSIYGDYANLNTCEPGDVEAAAVRAAMRSAREGCYGLMENDGSVEIGNTSVGMELDITTAFCELGESAIAHIVKADHAKLPARQTTMSTEPPEVAAAWQSVARERGARAVTAREVALSVERLEALGTDADVTAEPAQDTESVVVTALETAPMLEPCPLAAR